MSTISTTEKQQAVQIGRELGWSVDFQDSYWDNQWEEWVFGDVVTFNSGGVVSSTIRVRFSDGGFIDALLSRWRLEMSRGGLHDALQSSDHTITWATLAGWLRSEVH
jgi:hypothetical protein